MINTNNSFLLKHLVRKRNEMNSFKVFMTMFSYILNRGGGGVYGMNFFFQVFISTVYILFIWAEKKSGLESG